MRISCIFNCVSKQTISSSHEIVIPLMSDSAFFEMLSTALQSTHRQLSNVQSEFTDTLQGLSRSISNTARPMSSTSSNFHPHSILAHPGTIRPPAYGNKVRIQPLHSAPYSMLNVDGSHVVEGDIPAVCRSRGVRKRVRGFTWRAHSGRERDAIDAVR